LDIISENIANANNTHGLDGKPYQRQVVVFESAPHQATNASAPSQSTAPYRARIENDIRSPLTVYHPGHPDADSQGMVSLPNINIDEEMAEMSNASQSMTANLTIVNNYARTRAMQTLAMGRH
jgi:flagellar basal-body rod protein FlgC